ncbi:MAG: PilZ domain-containing protein [Nitrospirales bacterium]|nr:PilZ domain-containing protein [Nitrospirales bacterium]
MARQTSVAEDQQTPAVSVKEERRASRRISVKHQQGLSVVIRCRQETLCQGYLVNLSTEGMLVDFPKGQLPPVPIGTGVSVKLHYLGDSIWLPGMVRHRIGSKVGFHFPALTKMKTAKATHPLSVVVQALSRAGLTA